MTENHRTTAEFEGETYTAMLGTLAGIEAKISNLRRESKKKKEDAGAEVIPDSEAYDAAYDTAYGTESDAVYDTAYGTENDTARDTAYGTAFTELYGMISSSPEWRPDIRRTWRQNARRRMPDEPDGDGGLGSVVQISVDAIRPNRSQPRTNFGTNSVIRLADSIRRYGILQPLSVRVISVTGAVERGCATESASGGRISAEKLEFTAQNRVKFEIIAGERRFRAAKMVGMESVPCIIVSADDKRSAELSLIENLLREDLDIFETARAIKKLIETFHMTQEEVAKRLSMSQSAVANKLRLLRFTAEEEKVILENHLTERHARALLRISDPTDRLDAIGEILSRRLNVSATEAYIDKLLSEPRAEPDCPEAKRIPIIKDIRLFYNSLDRAVELVRTAGVDIESRRREDEAGVTIEIKIPHPRKCFT